MDEENDALSLADLQRRIPMLREKLEQIRRLLPGMLGHNGPPDPFPLKANEIDELEEALVTFASINDQDLIENRKYYQELADKIKRVSSAVILYCARKGDLFAEAAIEAAGEQVGKWGVRLGMVVLGAGALSQFSDDLTKLVQALQ